MAEARRGDEIAQLPVIVGATAAGKTALALALAAHLPIEVVSADSRTVYRWLDVGTAKPSAAEQARVPHHLLDVVDPDEPFTLAQYQQLALDAIARIRERGRLPVLVGGAGLYVSAVCDGLVLPDVAPDPAFRAALEQRAREEGWQALQRELAKVDPESAARIDPKNVRRVIRALEVFRATGTRFSDLQPRRADRPFEPTFIGVHVERRELQQRIDARIDAWLAAGLLDEVKSLLERGYHASLPSMSGIGYRELSAVLRDELTLDQATQQIKLATHQYAKRQLTWFRKDQRIHWLDATTVLPVEEALGKLRLAHV
jgi:tRNA dimethylallyltransferase